MKLFKYENYYIATDANHVTQHRRVVTPWFYVRLKPIKYVKVKNIPIIYSCCLLYVNGMYSGWTDGSEKFINDKIKQKLEAVTAPFSFDERMAKECNQYFKSWENTLVYGWL